MPLKLAWLLVAAAIGLSGCTAAQRFALKTHYELDECAMQRMSASKFNGQQGYLQAHHECHYLVNLQKFRALELAERQEAEDARRRQDPLAAYPEACWEVVKNQHIDHDFPELRRPDTGLRGDMMARYRNQAALEKRNAQFNIWPANLAELSTEQLIEAQELMARSSVVGEDTLCSPWAYRELESIIGRAIRKRKPH
ncbi:hypothetical protein [Methylobacter sp. BlB1]|jgi:hypothetical protein|uniref:hypothetical protein n=1 Tax=Methylobacter sp. BlB1 TaxID=2785914 RepID=UPI001894CC60|nr:hypothetical protein [Methylobacter sp. BlB1]MBF6650730.1 hypothetical protein [Methylobacter sp. BlB1]